MPPARSSRKGSSVTLIGFVLIICSLVTQLITEQNYVSILRDIKTIQNTVVDLSQDIAEPSDPVYITDAFHLSSSSKPPIDSDTGVTFDAFVIRKYIEMYQWNEDKRLSMASGHKKYYMKEWSAKYIDHTKFRHTAHHHNPRNDEFMSSQHIIEQGLLTKYESMSNLFWSTNIMLGKYYISHDVHSILMNNVHSNDGHNWQDITHNIYQQHYASRTQCKMKDEYIYLTNEDADDEKEVDDEPSVGDVRIKWSALNLEGTNGTFVGSIVDLNELHRYVSDNKKEFVYLSVGRRDSIQDIIASFRADNIGHLYLFRGITLLCMCIGFICSSSYIPFFGGVVGCVLNIVACGAAVVFWLVMFVIVYFSATKVIAIWLIGAVLLGLLLLHKRAKENDKAD